MRGDYGIEGGWSRGLVFNPHLRKRLVSAKARAVAGRVREDLIKANGLGNVGG